MVYYALLTISYPYPISERRVVRLINLFVSVTDDSCFKQCEDEYIGGNPQPNLEKLRDCKARNCKHVDTENNVDVTITCLTCHEDELSSSFWSKAKNVYKFGPDVEKIHNGGQHLFKYSVPPGLYEIKCRLEKQFQLLNMNVSYNLQFSMTGQKATDYVEQKYPQRR